MRSHPAALPRPEYPRPDRQRGRIEGVDWLNLNGPWEFRFAPLTDPSDPTWLRSGPVPWPQQIIVPFCWESLAAWGEEDAAGNERYYSSRVFLDPQAVTSRNHRGAPRHECGWYRRMVEVPAGPDWTGKRVILTVGAADFATDCWCNGVHLGRHEGGYVPFEFDLTDALAGGNDGRQSAFLVLRVEDAMDNREQPVGKQWSWYTTTSGIWQTVFIEPRGAAHIASFRLVPDIDRACVDVAVVLAGPADLHRASIEVLPPQVANHAIDLGGVAQEGGIVTVSIPIAPLLLWEPDHPHLYPVVLRLRNPAGEVVDEVRTYVGMRKIGTAPAESADAPCALSLNNQPIYLRGALYQSYYPEGVYTAGDAATIRNDIAFARKAGFDFLRIHIKLDDPLVLYYADTLGMLIMQDFPNFGEGGDTPLGRRRFVDMMRAGIERDFNHPSIISWCIFNESWGFGGQSELVKLILPNHTSAGVPFGGLKLENIGSFAWIHQTWLLAKRLDPTRLIEDMSVVAWEHLAAYGHVDTDINSWHFYIDDYARAKAHITEVVARTHRGSSYNYIEGFAQRDAPLINSEYGGVGALDGDRDIGWSFKFLTNELRLHGQLSAYIFTELTDVEWERNGFLNYDRTAKEFGYDPGTVNHGDVLPIDAPPIRRVAPGDRFTVPVYSSHFSRRRRDGVIFTWRHSGVDSLGARHVSLSTGHGTINFPHHRVALAKAIELEMPKESMLCTLSVTALDPDGTVLAANHIKHYVCAGAPPEQDMQGGAVILRPRIQDWDSAEWSDGMSSRDEAARSGSCWGAGSGYFQWTLSDSALHAIDRAEFLRVLIELSSRKEGTPQTDHERQPSRCEVSLNGVLIQNEDLPDHPHDARGALSYLRGGRGEHGYLVAATISGSLLAAVAQSAQGDGKLLLRCSVHPALAGGLTVYGYDMGRYPCGPTLLIENNSRSEA